jgi:hypothetical protein
MNYILVIVLLLAGCASSDVEQPPVRCQNHYGMLLLCDDPRFKDDEQCRNPCGELDEQATARED